MRVKDLAHLFFVVLDDVGHFSPGSPNGEQILKERLASSLLSQLLLWLLGEPRDARIWKINLMAEKICAVSWILSI